MKLPLKVIVPIKRVPDPYGRVRLTSTEAIDESDIKWVINPFDEIALEEAVRIREAGLQVDIIAVSVGVPEAQDQLRTALAMGADSAIHVVTTEPMIDPGSVSALLAAVCREEAADLVLMGKQAIDDDNSQVGQRLAALLDWPQATCASQVKPISENEIEVHREIDAGREVVSLTLPAVITADLRLNEPRYVALPAIIRARNKPIRQVDPGTLPNIPAAQMRILSFELPEPRAAGRKVADVDELIKALREEAGVL